MWRLARIEKMTGKAMTQGVLIGERSMSFILTFQTYNNATTGSEGIMVDKVIESIFDSKRKIVIEFEKPVILTQKFE
jgi:hypothetical protein